MSNLKGTDLFVIQRPSNSAGKTDKGTYKLEASDLVQYLNAQDAVFFKGTADFTAADQAPTNPENGDLWINDDETNGGGLFAWGNHDPSGATVTLSDKAIYATSGFGDDGSAAGWYIIGGSSASGTLTGISANSPITVDDIDSNDIDPSAPRIQIKFAKHSDGSDYMDKVYPSGDEPGVVQSIAIASDVAAGADESPNPNAVVTADLLKATNDALNTATAGGITTLSAVQDPNPSARWEVDDYEGTSYDGDVSKLNVTQLIPDNSGATRSLAVSLADTNTPGVFLAPVDDDVDPAKADNAVADGKLSKVHAVTPNLLYEFYTPKDFSILSELPTD